MDLKLKSLGIVMAVVPLGCREYIVKQSKCDTGCEIEKQKRKE